MALFHSSSLSLVASVSLVISLTRSLSHSHSSSLSTRSCLFSPHSFFLPVPFTPCQPLIIVLARCLSLSHSLLLSLPYSFSLLVASVTRCLSHSLSWSPPSRDGSLSIFLSPTLPLSHSSSFPLFLFPTRSCLSSSLIVSLTRFLSFPHSFDLSLVLSPPPIHVLSLESFMIVLTRCLSIHLSLSLKISLSLPYLLPLSLGLSLTHSLGLPVTRWLSLNRLLLSVSHSLPLSLCMPVCPGEAASDGRCAVSRRRG